MSLTHSESLANLAPALVLVQAEVEHATKGNVNPAFKSRYVDITEVIDTIRPVLQKHGFSASQHPGFRDGAEGALVTLETLLLHESGEWIKSECATPLERVTAQGVGSAITYLRRYALTSIIGLGQEDDDGQSASQPRQQERPASRPASAPQPRSEAAPTQPALAQARDVGDFLSWAWREHRINRTQVLEILGKERPEDIGDLDEAGSLVASYAELQASRA